MALNGELQLIKELGYYYKIKWNVVAQNPVTNESTIYLRLEYHFPIADVGIGNICKVTLGNTTKEFKEVSGWYKAGDYLIGEGKFIVQHQSDHLQAALITLEELEFLKRKESAEITIDAIDRKPYILSFPNFEDEDNPSFTYLNKAGNGAYSLQAQLLLASNSQVIAARNIDKAGSAFTFELTDAERALLYNGINQFGTTNIKLELKSSVDSYNYLATSSAVCTYINYEPTLNPIVTVDSRTYELTGSNDIWIKGYTTLAFDTGAQAQKGANIEYQRISCGGTVLDDYTANTGTLEQVKSNTIYYKAVDTRGIEGRDFTLAQQLVAYYPLTVQLETEPLTGSGELTFKISGKYYSGSFGAKANSLELEYSVQDAYNEYVLATESGWQKLGVITPIVDGDNYSYEYTITGLDHSEQYKLTVNVIDALSPVQSSSTVVKAIPIFDWGARDFHHHTPVYMPNTEIPLDYVVEQGESGIWSYTKWNSGKVELWGRMPIESLDVTVELGGWYRSSVIQPSNYPFTVYEPFVMSEYESDGLGALIWVTTNAQETIKPYNLYLIRPTKSAVTGITGTIKFYTQGKWRQ